MDHGVRHDQKEIVVCEVMSQKEAVLLRRNL